MKVGLGINTGFALNRFTTPEEWLPLIADTFGLRIIQLTADIINPSLPPEVIKDHICRIRELQKKYPVRIEHTMTGAFTRVNHLAHPDEAVRNYWVDWFCRFAEISAELGAESMGSHFGIYTVRDYKDEKLRKERFEQNVEGWVKISDHARKCGLNYLTWEPMSIGREYGETLDETRRVQDVISEASSIPFKLCLDVDHGDVASSNPDDTDPYAWIARFGKESPIVHIKQTSADKSSHWPFTPEKNKIGRITPEKLLKALEEAGVEKVNLIFELSFREREPAESHVVSDIKASVDYWRPHVPE